MDAKTAVLTCLRKYAVFGGRASRSEYWFFTLATMIAQYAVSIVSAIAFAPIILGHMRPLVIAPGHPAPFDPAIFRMQLESQIPNLILVAVLFLPHLSVTVRRLHDLGRSGWWWWLNLIPIAGWLCLLVWECGAGTRGANRFGDDPLPADRPYMIEPLEAVRKCLRQSLRLKGRASRAEFWFFVLFGTVFNWVVTICAMIAMVVVAAVNRVLSFGAPPNPMPILGIMALLGIIMLLLLVPTSAVAVRRLHDIGRSGWWSWLYCIPLVGLVLILVWGCAPGTSGPNRYGPDPLAGEARPERQAG